MELKLARCAICGHEAHFIPPTHFKKHGITTAEYKSKYPNFPLCSPSYLAAATERNRRHNALRKGTVRTAEEKAKMSATKKARYESGDTVAWNKGLNTWTEEQKQERSIAIKHQYATGKRIHHMQGKHHSANTKSKISDSLVGRTIPAEILAKKVQTMTIKKENGWIHHNSVHVSDETRVLINDPVWIRHQHFDLKRSLTEIAQSLGVDPTMIQRKFKEFKLGTPQRFAVATNEKEIVEYLTGLGIKVISNTRRIIPPLELDIFLPEFNIAIEHCGIYWHSSKHKASDYHLHKLQKCVDKGVRLITLFEDEWTFNRKVVERVLFTILDRSQLLTDDFESVNDCDIQPATQFVNDFSLDTTSCDKVIGLQQDNVLHAIIDYTVQNNVILINKVVSKVRILTIDAGLQHLQQLYPHCTTFEWVVDSRWDDGKLCTQSGFVLDSILPPDFYWVKGLTRHHHTMFTPDTTHNTPVSDTRKKGQPTWYHLFDCGKQKWTRDCASLTTSS